MNIPEDEMNNIQIKKNINEFKHRMKMVIKNGTGIISTSAFSFEKFNFNENWRSDIIKEEEFTNYVKSCNVDYYKLLKEIFVKLYHDNYSFLDEFELDDYIPSKYSPSGQRLNRIIMKFTGIDDEKKLPKIDEFKPTRYQMKKNKRFNTLRLFVSKNEETGIIDLLLVDIYHLGVDAFNYNTNRYDTKVHYENAKEYTEDISKVYEELEN